MPLHLAMQCRDKSLFICFMMPEDWIKQSYCDILSCNDAIWMLLSLLFANKLSLLYWVCRINTFSYRTDMCVNYIRLLPVLSVVLQWFVHVCVCAFMFACMYLNCKRNLVHSNSCLMMCSVCKDQLACGVLSAWVLIASQLSLVMMPSTLSRHEATDDTANIHTLKTLFTIAHSACVKHWIYLI